MKDDQFDRLFKYIIDMDKRIGDEFADVHREIRSLRDTPEVIVGRLNDAETEQAARDAQFARLVEWARKVSKKTGVPLPDL